MSTPLCIRILIVAAATTAAVSAAPLCSSGPLSGYTAVGFECEVDGAVFSDFSLFTTGSITTTPLDEDEITVSPLSGPSQVGLRFAGDFISTGTANGPGPAQGNLNVTYRFFFSVERSFSEFLSATTVLNNPTRFSPNPLKFGGILSGKSITNDGALAITNDMDPDLTDTGLLFTPRQMITIDETLSLVGGASAANTAAPVGVVTLESVDNLFAYQESPIPEPNTLSLVAGCVFVLALGLLRRRRNRLNS